MAIFINLFLGSYSDVMGRKLVLLLPIFGHFLRDAAVPIIIYFDLGLPGMYVGYLLDGLFGGFSGQFPLWFSAHPGRIQIPDFVERSLVHLAETVCLPYSRPGKAKAARERSGHLPHKDDPRVVEIFNISLPHDRKWLWDYLYLFIFTSAFDVENCIYLMSQACDPRETGSNPCKNGHGSTLCEYSAAAPMSQPRVASVARKWPRSFC